MIINKIWLYQPLDPGDEYVRPKRVKILQVLLLGPLTPSNLIFFKCSACFCREQKMVQNEW